MSEALGYGFQPSGRVALVTMVVRATSWTHFLRPVT
jgi:hypothetical protein